MHVGVCRYERKKIARYRIIARYDVFEKATLYFTENGRYDGNHVLYALNHAKHVSVIARYFFFRNKRDTISPNKNPKRTTPH